MLSDAKTAVFKAVLDGKQITALRPAAVSLVAAGYLARADSRRIAFIACGTQAMAHLKAFTKAFPLREVTCYSRPPNVLQQSPAGGAGGPCSDRGAPRWTQLETADLRALDLLDWNADFAELANRVHPGRTSDRQRAFLIHLAWAICSARG